MEKIKKKRIFTSEEYQEEYLKSEWWIKRRDKYVKLVGSKCEECGKRGQDVHHQSYRNLWDEKDEDLMFLCRKCHENKHKKKQKKTIYTHKVRITAQTKFILENIKKLNNNNIGDKVSLAEIASYIIKKYAKNFKRIIKK